MTAAIHFALEIRCRVEREMRETQRDAWPLWRRRRAREKVTKPRCGYTTLYYTKRANNETGWLGRARIRSGAILLRRSRIFIPLSGVNGFILFIKFIAPTLSLFPCHHAAVLSHFIMREYI
jgi:hypothetical protein